MAHQIGSKIYYTGDMANQPGWFRVTKDTIRTVDLQEIDGDRTKLGVYACGIGSEYHGHCNPRFVTEAAYNAYKAARQAAMQEVYAKYAKQS